MWNKIPCTLATTRRTLSFGNCISWNLWYVGDGMLFGQDIYEMLCHICEPNPLVAVLISVVTLKMRMKTVLVPGYIQFWIVAAIEFSETYWLQLDFSISVLWHFASPRRSLNVNQKCIDVQVWTDKIRQNAFFLVSQRCMFVFKSLYSVNSYVVLTQIL